MRRASPVLVACLLTACAGAAEKPPAAPPGVVLRSARAAPGVPLAEVKASVCAVRLELDAAGKGDSWTGKLVLDPNTPHLDEFGDRVTGREADNVARTPPPWAPAVTLDCTLEFVRAGFVPRVNESATRRSVYRVKGPKITSPLFFVTAGPGLTSGRLLVHDKLGKVAFAVEMRKDEPPVEGGLPVPCHPGCFPAGTPVATPAGPRAIEGINVGDMVVTVSPDGRAGRAAVGHVFVTTNRLIEVRTDRGPVTTPDAQPLCLSAGGFKRAGDLKPGDRVKQWRDGKPADAVVREVAATGRDAKVFNLILGDSAVFVAGGFLARGKPPAERP